MVHTATLSGVVRERQSFQTASQERNGLADNERERTAMSTETRMAIKHSRPMPQRSESGVGHGLTEENVEEIGEENNQMRSIAREVNRRMERL
jgi:hypothetical protein